MFALIPIGKIDPAVLKYLMRELKAAFGKEVKILPQIKVPQHSYNNLRKQYNAKTILDFVLSDFEKEKFDKIFAVIDRDIYTPELNFVFGKVDDIGGRKAIISITRLREEFYTRAADKKVFLKRIFKETTHELGHLCGMTHCANPKCIMYFSHSILDTDNKGETFCRACQLALKSKSKS